MANAKNGASFERVAALYDVHGNLHALEAALEDVRDAQVDRIVFGGDVFPGPLSHSALELLLSLTPQPLFLHGNGDREVLRLANGEPPSALPETVLAGMRWEAERLSERHRAQLERWPATLRLEVQGVGRVLFCHATPRNDTDVFTRETAEPKLRPHFAEVDADLVVVRPTPTCSSTRRVGSARVVNAGSVGGCRSAMQAHIGCSWGRRSNTG